MCSDFLFLVITLNKLPTQKIQKQALVSQHRVGLGYFLLWVCFTSQNTFYISLDILLVICKHHVAFTSTLMMQNSTDQFGRSYTKWKTVSKAQLNINIFLLNSDKTEILMSGRNQFDFTVELDGYPVKPKIKNKTNKKKKPWCNQLFVFNSHIKKKKFLQNKIQ